MFLQSISTRWLVLLAAVLLFGAASDGPRAVAQSAIERLVSPGKLSDAHVEQEKECSACHASFNKKAQSGLCRECHDTIDADIRAGSGFHGKFPGISEEECKTCHTEHEGRIADIVGLDPKTFDHSFTDYRLEGKHAGAECSGCHKDGEKYSDAPHACVSCHQGDDPHFGRLGTECASCHVPDRWERIRFDHSKTSFALLGAHADTKCSACHMDQVWKGVGAECIDCHLDDDAHDGRFGPQCASCHEPASWTKIKFNHDATGFRLSGQHAAIECAACHGAGKPDPAPTACIGCHRGDDKHKGRNGPDCAACHSSSDWKRVSFDHASTGFALLGRHRSAACEACHTRPIQEWKPPKGCIDCHADDDRHEGLLGTDCSGCHRETGWTEVRFDHARDTRFALLGKHQAVTCAACHKTPTTQSLPTVSCAGCHRADDPHKGQLGDGCGQCHNVESWTGTVKFNHDFTDFPLLGKHASVDCVSCHESKAYLDAPNGCHGCHAEDDVHKGGLGKDCASCHNPKAWEFWAFDHNTQTSFALTGKHAVVTCSGCHPARSDGQFKASSRCVSCHASDDKHRGAFGTSCERCHNTEAFWAVDIAR